MVDFRNCSLHHHASLSMEHPNGSVDGLCSAAANGFALCVAFLVAWGFQGQGHWRGVDLWVILPLALAAGGFGFTPYVVTRPVEAPVRAGRRLYGASVVAVMVAVVCALILEYSKG
jgi:hypothetical protein